MGIEEIAALGVCVRGRPNGSRPPAPPRPLPTGKRIIVLWANLRGRLNWYAEKGSDRLSFVGENGKPFRRSTFGRNWRATRSKVDFPNGFRFSDLPHAGHTLATRSGPTLKDAMVRTGPSTERAAHIYQHSAPERQREVLAGLDQLVRARREAVYDQAPCTDMARDI